MTPSRSSFRRGLARIKVEWYSELMKKYDYDLIVIGAGSGLDVAVGAATHLDWKVALVEKGPLGGTCLNRGCIPSKIVIHAANLAESIRQANRFGIHASIDRIDFAAVTSRANHQVDAESAQMEESFLGQDRIHLYKETGYFVAPRTLRVGAREIRGERILVAAGARPAIPAIEGLDRVDYWTSTEALRQTSQPRSLIIIGGGFIGAELGHFYGALGTKITLIQKSGRLLPREDRDISREFTRIFSSRYQVLLEHTVTGVRQEADGAKILTVADAQGRSQTLEADALLVAAGLQSNADLLRLENSGVETDSRGYIKVNEYLETTAENVWALGDIIGRAQYKHAANKEAQHVFWSFAGGHRHSMDYEVMPRAVFTSPQIAAVGPTEQEAEAQGLKYEVLRLGYLETGMGFAIGAEEGFVKFLIDPTQSRILACHILGPDASTLIHEVIVVMAAMEGSMAAVTVATHIHPSLSEVIQRAL